MSADLCSMALGFCTAEQQSAFWGWVWIGSGLLVMFFLVATITGEMEGYDEGYREGYRDGQASGQHFGNDHGAGYDAPYDYGFESERRERHR